MFRKPFLLVFLLMPLLCIGQQKTQASDAIWPELHINYGVGEGGILFFRNQYRINRDERFNDLFNENSPVNFERIELSIGYEQTFSEHWRGGAMLRYAAEDYPKQTFYSLFARQNGNIFKLFFHKQLMFEYVDRGEQGTLGRFRFSSTFGKRLALGKRFITPAVDVETLILSDLGRDENAMREQRFIDRSRLRLNLNYELTEKLRINPYFMRQVDYYYVMVPPVYNGMGVLVEKGYTTKRNRVSPVIGLEFKYNLNRSSETASISY